MQTTDNLTFYKKNGFAIFRNLLSDDEVSHYKELMRNVFPEVTYNCT